MAWIAVERLTDFIEEENYKEDFNTSFTIRAHHEVNAGEGDVLRTHRHYRSMRIWSSRLTRIDHDGLANYEDVIIWEEILVV